jgi:hypothetical protein
MKRLIEKLLPRQRLVSSTIRKFFGSLDDFNTAMHTGKALDNIQTTINDSNEITDITEVSIDSQKSEEHYPHNVGVVVVTENVPTRVTLLKIKRFLDNTNRRFGTHLTSRIIQR